MAFDKPVRNRGRFPGLGGRFEVVVGTRRLIKGRAVPKASRSRIASWWRRGWIKACGDYAKYRKDQHDNGSGNPDTIVSAEEGARGWWTVNYEDGTTRKMRYKALEETGYFDQEESGEGGSGGDGSGKGESGSGGGEEEGGSDPVAGSGDREGSGGSDIEVDVEVDVDTDEIEAEVDVDGDITSNPT